MRESQADVSPTRATQPVPGTPDVGSSGAEVKSELEAMLEADSSVLGEVFRRLSAAETPEQIRAARGAERPNFV